MDMRQLKDVCAQLGRERHVMHYYKDRYAPMLLHWAAGNRARISNLKRSRFAGLLEKPAIKTETAASGNGLVYPMMLDACLPRESDLTYRLTFGQWPLPEDELNRFWDQISTRGYTLVVQLNFTGEHDETYRRNIGVGREQYLNSYSHPINECGRNTLAWARIDFDIETGEALIEEVQSDWVRTARRIYQEAQVLDEEARGNVVVLGRWSDNPVTAAAFSQYYETCLMPHTRVWSEATLAATLGVVIDLLSIRRIWMHGFETGNRLKRLNKSDNQPPASLYKELPRRFCFERTGEAPSFLLDRVNKKMRSWLKSGNAQFWRHAF